MQRNDQDKFDFDYWMQLAKDDPERFERERRRMVESMIAQAPSHMKHRLAGLQWQIDRSRERAKSPMAACLNISQMMWDRVLRQDGLVDRLNGLINAPDFALTPARKSAEILPFAGRAGVSGSEDEDGGDQ